MYLAKVDEDESPKQQKTTAGLSQSIYYTMQKR